MHNESGTFLGELYRGCAIEVDEDVCGVDVVASSSDPAGAMPQADEVCGSGPPSINDDAAVVIENVLVSRKNGGLGQTVNDDAEMLRSARDLLAGQDGPEEHVRFELSEGIVLMNFRGNQAMLNGQKASVDNYRPILVPEAVVLYRSCFVMGRSF
jgi:hypothetical protein